MEGLRANLVVLLTSIIPPFDVAHGPDLQIGRDSAGDFNGGLHLDGPWKEMVLLVLDR